MLKKSTVLVNTVTCIGEVGASKNGESHDQGADEFSRQEHGRVTVPGNRSCEEHRYHDGREAVGPSGEEAFVKEGRHGAT